LPTPSGEIGFTLTPQSGTATVLLNGSANPISGCIYDPLLPAKFAGSISDCAGNVLVISASIGNPGALTPAGATFGGDILVSIPPVNPITLVANPPVSNAGFTVPVSVLVQEQAGLTVSPTAVSFTSTLGQASVAPPTTATLSYTLIGNDTYTVTSNQPWAVVVPVPPSTNPSGAALATFTLSINLAAAGAPTKAGVYTAIITAAPTGPEPAAVTTVTLTVLAPPSLTVGGVTGAPGTPGTAATGGQTVTYNYGAANPAALSIAESISPTASNTYPSIPLTYSAITYSNGATGWLTLTTAPATITGAGATLVASVNPTGPPAVAPGTYTATFTVTATDAGVAPTYTSVVTYTVTLNVVGSLSATSANSTFTYVIGTSSNDLPLVIASQPPGVTFNITTSANLAASIMTGTTPQTPEITVNGAALITASATPGQFNETLGIVTGRVTVSVLNSLVNCPAAQVSGTPALCTVTIPYTINVHPSFFQGETAIGGGFYTLPGFGTYTYLTGLNVIYHTQLGQLGLIPVTDASRGIYFYDFITTHTWYTNPADFPYIYDFAFPSWLYYYVGSGNGTAGSRSFYEFLTSKIIFE